MGAPGQCQVSLKTKIDAAGNLGRGSTVSIVDRAITAIPPPNHAVNTMLKRPSPTEYHHASKTWRASLTDAVLEVPVGDDAALLLRH